MPTLTSGAVIAISVCVVANVLLLAAIFDLQRRRRELLVRARCATHVKYHSNKNGSTTTASSANAASVYLLMQAAALQAACSMRPVDGCIAVLPLLTSILLWLASYVSSQASWCMHSSL
jgi:hypothetical protein